MDIFDREQKVYEEAAAHLEAVENGDPCDSGKFAKLLKEYGRLLRQFRRVTKIHDRITVDLNKSKLDLLSKVHYDVLTGICNRRYLDDNLKRVVRSLSRSGGMLSVLMIDIDYFKLYNDAYGHSTGDICLKSIAVALSDCMKRADDFLARYGGEEFIAVLPSTDEKGARAMAKRLLERVESLNIPHEHSKAAGRVTISIGAATGLVEHPQTGCDYIMMADTALYMSKRNGRNQYTYLNMEGKSE